MRLLLLLIVGAVVIAAVRVAANLYTADTTLILQVGGQQTGQIDLNQSFAISPYLLGSNVFPRAGTNSKDQAGSGFMSYDQQVILGLQSAGIKLLRFPGGATASLWASFESPEEQELTVVTKAGRQRLERPFSSIDPDPYRLMVESFGESVLSDQPVAISLSESIANMRVLDRIREAAKSAS